MATIVPCGILKARGGVTPLRGRESLSFREDNPTAVVTKQRTAARMSNPSGPDEDATPTAEETQADAASQAPTEEESQPTAEAEQAHDEAPQEPSADESAVDEEPTQEAQRPSETPTEVIST